jgi:hypothetical protein
LLREAMAGDFTGTVSVEIQAKAGRLSRPVGTRRRFVGDE